MFLSENCVAHLACTSFKLRQNLRAFSVQSSSVEIDWFTSALASDCVLLVPVAQKAPVLQSTN